MLLRVQKKRESKHFLDVLNYLNNETLALTKNLRPSTLSKKNTVVKINNSSLLFFFIYFSSKLHFDYFSLSSSQSIYTKIGLI